MTNDRDLSDAFEPATTLPDAQRHYKDWRRARHDDMVKLLSGTVWEIITERDGVRQAIRRAWHVLEELEDFENGDWK